MRNLEVDYSVLSQQELIYHKQMLERFGEKAVEMGKDEIFEDIARKLAIIKKLLEVR